MTVTVFWHFGADGSFGDCGSGYRLLSGYSVWLAVNGMGGPDALKSVVVPRNR